MHLLCKRVKARAASSVVELRCVSSRLRDTFVCGSNRAAARVATHRSNRSASVLTALLMLPPHNLSLDAAYSQVKARRKEANPLTDNRRELFAFEAALHGGVTSLTEGDWMKK